MGLLPGVLMRNFGLKFMCKTIILRVGDCDSAFTSGYKLGAELQMPIAHHDGNYTVDPQTLAMLQAEGRVAFTYAQNPNGSMGDIAGLLSSNRRVLGMMPHPERATESVLGSTDGCRMFKVLVGQLACA
jgi:phosphoribosylformylglycinamidine (FGAM) synthase-like amidotransferase family enzyme